MNTPKMCFLTSKQVFYVQFLILVFLQIADNDELTVNRKIPHFSCKDAVGLKKCQYFDVKIQKFYDRIWREKVRGKKQEICRIRRKTIGEEDG